MGDNPATARLDTWKAIGTYLGRSSRTVQRWHDEYGLPVHHLAGTAGSVYAYTDELEPWLRNRGTKTRDRPDPVQRGQAAHLDRELIKLGESASAVVEPPWTDEAKARSSRLTNLGDSMSNFANGRTLGLLTRHYRAAIDLDPWNAPALAGLSLSLIAQGIYGVVHPPLAYTSAQAAVDCALMADDQSTLAHCAKAWLELVYTRRWESAQSGFDTILESAPPELLSLNNTCLNGKGLVFVTQGAFDEAYAQFDEALQWAPLHGSSPAFQCWSRYLAREYRAALHKADEFRAVGHMGPVLDAVEALCAAHDEGGSSKMDQLGALATASPRHEVLHGALAYGYAMKGQAGRAHKVLDDFTRCQHQGMHPEPYAVAVASVITQKRPWMIK